MMPFKNTDGFTLIEMMVALSVFALLGAMGVTMLSGFASAQTKLLNSDAFLSSMQQSRATIQGDLENAVKRPVRDLYGSAGTSVFIGNPAESETVLFRLVRGGHMAALISDDAPSVQRVDYLFKDNTLVRRSYAKPDATPETPIEEIPLLKGVEQAKVRFHAGDRWSEEWGTLSNGVSRFPYLLELVLKLEGKGTVTHVFSVGASQ